MPLIELNMEAKKPDYTYILETYEDYLEARKKGYHVSIAPIHEPGVYIESLRPNREYTKKDFQSFIGKYVVKANKKRSVCVFRMVVVKVGENGGIPLAIRAKSYEELLEMQDTYSKDIIHTTPVGYLIFPEGYEYV